LLNTDGYWQPLLSLIHHVVKEGFAGDDIHSFVQSVDDVGSLKTALQSALD